MENLITKIDEFINESNEWVEMDLAMDGSGECGSMIHKNHSKRLRRFVDGLIQEGSIGLGELLTELNAKAKEEREYEEAYPETHDFNTVHSLQNSIGSVDYEVNYNNVLQEVEEAFGLSQE